MRRRCALIVTRVTYRVLHIATVGYDGYESILTALDVLFAVALEMF